MLKFLLRTPLILINLFLISSPIAFGQHVITFHATRAVQEQDESFRKQFAHYSLATLNTEETSAMLRSEDYFEEIRINTPGFSFRFDLKAHDLRSPDYVLKALTENGVIELPRTSNKTWYGYTRKENRDVRITADEHYFSALIQLEDDEVFIEPARNIHPDSPADQFVIYRASDNLIKLTFDNCHMLHPGEHEHQQHDAPNMDIPSDKEDGRSMSERACKVVQVALANDLLMHNKYGGVAGVENHNLTVLNNVQTNYDDEFVHNLEFSVTAIFVVTTPAQNPWTNSNNPEALLNDFTDWGPSGFGAVHDIASLWTDRDFTGSTVGLAWLNSLCSPFRYHVLEDFTGNASHLRVLQAHEMGHNFAANHDAAGSNFIMAPAVSNATAWSTASQNAINNKINSVSCLSSCSAPLPPVANFSGSPTSGCAPLTVSFTNQSQNNPTSYSWSFPGGTPSSSTAQNPTVTYNNPGTYNVSLTVSNTQGSDTHTKTNYISVGQAPDADFDFVVNGTSVTFFNQSTNGTSYFWDFDDGFTSTATNPVHVFDEDGLYYVTLTVTNSCGSDVITRVIEIITPPTADFSANSTFGCAPYEVFFYNHSSPNATNYYWVFEGGIPGSSTAYEPVVLYESPGTYDVTLTASNAAGEDVQVIHSYITIGAYPSAQFTFTANGLQVSFNSQGSIGDTYYWDFGDDQFSYEANPVHIYAIGGQYTVRLTVTNDCGTHYVTETITVIGTPLAQFSASQQSGCAPLVVEYTNQSAGNPTSFLWSFEGGSPSSSTLPNPVVTYNTPGTFSVELTVTNGAGSNTIFYNDYIEVGYPPVSDFEYVINGSTVTFFNYSTNASSYAWEFGDGNGSFIFNPVHTFDNDGTYVVTLQVEGECGIDIKTIEITIATPPQANFSFNASGDCAPATVQFTNQSSSNATSFLWSFPGGNPSSSNQTNPVVTYSTAGTYHVTLIAFSPAGADTLSWPAFIDFGMAPDAHFLISTDGLQVEFTNSTSGASDYFWDFGDGEFSSLANPVHVYPDFGTYTITLIATNECGPDTSSITIVLGTSPNAFFTYNIHTGCVPFSVQFFDQSQNGPTSWLWTFEGGSPATSTAQNPIVTYNSPGVYSVTLAVSNAEGTDVLALDALIKAGGPPEADFTYLQNDNVVFLTYSGAAYDSLQWNFGNGRTDNSLNPTANYDQPGEYEISLIVFNPCGSDTASVWVQVESTATNSPYENKDGWQVRPNPFQDVLTLYGEPDTDGEMNIAIYDMHGRLISADQWTYQGGKSLKEIPAANFPSGMLLISLYNQESYTILKAIKQ